MVPDDWEAWLEHELLGLLSACAEKLRADGASFGAAGRDAASAVRAVLDRWEASLADDE